MCEQKDFVHRSQEHASTEKDVFEEFDDDEEDVVEKTRETVFLGYFVDAIDATVVFLSRGEN